MFYVELNIDKISFFWYKIKVKCERIQCTILIHHHFPKHKIGNVKWITLYGPTLKLIATVIIKLTLPSIVSNPNLTLALTLALHYEGGGHTEISTLFVYVLWGIGVSF